MEFLHHMAKAETLFLFSVYVFKTDMDCDEYQDI